MTLSINDNQHEQHSANTTLSINGNQHDSIKCYNAECRISFTFMLNVVMLSVVAPQKLVVVKHPS
jgi:hypothetical protein